MHDVTRRTILTGAALLVPAASSMSTSQSQEDLSDCDLKRLSPGVAQNAANLVIPVYNQIVAGGRPPATVYAAGAAALNALLLNWEEAGLNSHCENNMSKYLREAHQVDFQAVRGLFAQHGLIVQPELWNATLRLLHGHAVPGWRRGCAGVLRYFAEQSSLSAPLARAAYRPVQYDTGCYDEYGNPVDCTTADLSWAVAIGVFVGGVALVLAIGTVVVGSPVVILAGAVLMAAAAVPLVACGLGYCS